MDLTPEQEAKLKDTNLGKLKELVDNAAVDYLKGIEGMKQPGTRVRKAMLAAKNLTLDIRKELLGARPNKDKK
jgi:hypothetical protein